MKRSLSISRAWDESKAVLATDGNLLIAVALALIVLPGVISSLVQPTAKQGELPEPGAWLLVAFLALIVGLVGQLAIISLAIRGGTTVGAAIHHSARRILPLLGAFLLVATPIALLLAVLRGAIGATPEQANPAVALVALLAFPLFLFFIVRLLLMAPVAGAETAGPLVIIRRSWGLTRGHWWRLFGFFLLFIVAALVVAAALAPVFGSAATLLFGSVERFTLGALVIALISQVIGAALTIVFMVMLARIYVQLAGDGVAAAETSVPSSGG